MPLATWLRQDLREYVQDTLLASDSCIGHFIEPDKVSLMLNEHTSCRRNWHIQLWRLLVLESWLRANKAHDVSQPTVATCSEMAFVGTQATGLSASRGYDHDQSRFRITQGQPALPKCSPRSRYGAFLGGTVKTPYADLGIHDSASTDYGALPQIFENAISPSDVLVDIGCGKGRVINWWLSRGYTNRMVGLEIDSEVARQTADRLRK